MSEQNRQVAKEKHHVTASLDSAVRPQGNCTHEHYAEEHSFLELRNLPEDFSRTMTVRLARMAEQSGAPRDECEDLAQEAWLRAFTHAEQFRGEHALGELCSWLAVVVHNLAVDAARRRDALLMDSLDALRVELVDERERDRANIAEWTARLTVSLARLQQEQPENCWLLCQRYLEGRAVEELAEETGWKAHEVSCRIYRAKQKIRSWRSESTSGGRDAS